MLLTTCTGNLQLNCGLACVPWCPSLCPWGKACSPVSWSWNWAFDRCLAILAAKASATWRRVPTQGITHDEHMDDGRHQTIYCKLIELGSWFHVLWGSIRPYYFLYSYVWMNGCLFKTGWRLWPPTRAISPGRGSRLSKPIDRTHI